MPSPSGAVLESDNLYRDPTPQFPDHPRNLIRIKGHQMITKTISAALFTTATLVALSIAGPASADAQRAQARANFLEADVNKDEQLDLAEFTTFINLNADHNLGRAGLIRRFGMHGKAFGQADANRDGVVSKEEIATQAQQ